MGAELIQFVGALFFMVAILVGSYWFVYAPVRDENRKEDERRKQER